MPSIDDMEPLTDKQWRNIVAIRRPLVSEADARAAIDLIRAEYFPLKSVTTRSGSIFSAVH
jgi:predicted YcjX-like family ATPase